MGSRAVFLDRDKTIVLPKGGEKYIYRVEDFYIPDNFVEALKQLVDNDFLLFVITNQGRVARRRCSGVASMPGLYIKRKWSSYIRV